jgi:hypothetical protein
MDPWFLLPPFLSYNWIRKRFATQTNAREVGMTGKRDDYIRKVYREEIEIVWELCNCRLQLPASHEPYTRHNRCLQRLLHTYRVNHRHWHSLCEHVAEYREINWSKNNDDIECGDHHEELSSSGYRIRSVRLQLWRDVVEHNPKALREVSLWLAYRSNVSHLTESGCKN